jgi:hypothetical protein
MLGCRIRAGAARQDSRCHLATASWKWTSRGPRGFDCLFRMLTPRWTIRRGGRPCHVRPYPTSSGCSHMQSHVRSHASRAMHCHMCVWCSGRSIGLETDGLCVRRSAHGLTNNNGCQTLRCLLKALLTCMSVIRGSGTLSFDDGLLRTGCLVRAVSRDEAARERRLPRRVLEVKPRGAWCRRAGKDMPSARTEFSSLPEIFAVESRGRVSVAVLAACRGLCRGV